MNFNQLLEQFDIDIIISSCIYLAAKVNEYEQVRIRDIVNVVKFSQNELNLIKDLIKS